MTFWAVAAVFVLLMFLHRKVHTLAYHHPQWPNVNVADCFLRWFIFVLFLWVSVYPFLRISKNARLLREGLRLCEELEKLPPGNHNP